MKLFQTETIYDAKTDEWVEKYWVNGQEVDADLYFFEIERERDLEIQKLEEQEDEMDELCDCPECTLDRYTGILSEMTGGCSGCIREVLQDFMMDVVDHIVIEDMEDDMVQEGRPLN